ncbi:hypothetical protein Hanom_Chr02g00153421 [Helianthus anomalus]
MLQVNPYPIHTPIRDPAVMAAVFPIGETHHRNHSPSTPRTPSFNYVKGKLFG